MSAYWLDGNTSPYRKDPWFNEPTHCVRYINNGSFWDRPCTRTFRYVCKKTVGMSQSFKSFNKFIAHMHRRDKLTHSSRLLHNDRHNLLDKLNVAYWTGMELVSPDNWPLDFSCSCLECKLWCCGLCFEMISVIPALWNLSSCFRPQEVSPW